MGLSLLSSLTALPYLLLNLAAVVVASARWSRHPVVSLLVIVSVLVSLLNWGVSLVLPGLAADLVLAAAVRSSIGALANGLLVVAVFSGRSTTVEAPARRW